ncbi:hypothetical protein EK21DRAFT_100998 [Setomelanomma holmii]|uniref:Uncharacterized protein n=1 Tax=Setomelanomma holmii TaxID=210430 RepID=A0A9P4HAK7_9PLEO|nr:hypothetical protein EK21DRAFT_100998 [Setomelanomma holmii]
MKRGISLENLLGRLSCSGKGILIRNACHKKSTFFLEYDCTEYVQCGTNTTQRQVETRPCVSCKVATCNECRIHCVYQSIYEKSSDPEDPAELPNFSGFVLLEPLEQPILSPHHLSDLVAACPRWQDPGAGYDGPHHDQGHLDVPLQLSVDAPPECIDDVLERDLSQRLLMSISADSRYGSPSPVLSSICRVTEARLLFLCNACFGQGTPKGPMATWPQFITRSRIAECHCTLKKRFLDRWLCLRCYLHEDSAITVFTSFMPTRDTGLCLCGGVACHTVCLWCWGSLVGDDHGNELSAAIPTDNEDSS